MKNYNNIPHNRLAKYKNYLSRENINLLDKVECNWIAPINFETIRINEHLLLLLNDIKSFIFLVAKWKTYCIAK